MVDSGITLRRQWFISSRGGKIEDYYQFDIKKSIGSGTYGNVIKATIKGGTQLRAIKVITKSKVSNQQRFKTEIEIMKKLDHPNVIKLYETFEDQRNIYLVMELCDGGELFDKIIDKGHFTEKEARIIFTQIMSALCYCHNNKIAHRDLKPENFLLLNKKPDSPIKIIDFGLSTIFGQDAQKQQTQQSKKVSMQTKAGTPYYISPEVLKGDYDESCDIWSAGVILYILLSGVPPFYGNTDQEILDAVKSGIFSFDIPEFEGVDESAKDLIKKMITKPKQRLTASQILQHKWMLADPKIKESKLKLNINSLKQFQNFQKLKKAALTYIASQLSENEISELGNLFKSLDKDNNGVLTIDEIKSALQGHPLYQEIEQIMKGIDTDGSGEIEYTEFLAATLDRNIYLKDEKLFQAFRNFDLDGSGKIDAKELKLVLGSDKNFQNVPDSYWEQIIKEVDKNGDGEIDYGEFLDMMDKMK